MAGQAGTGRRRWRAGLAVVAAAVALAVGGTVAARLVADRQTERGAGRVTAAPTHSLFMAAIGNLLIHGFQILLSDHYAQFFPFVEKVA